MNFKSKNLGFTLSEVMLAISLVGVLATLTISTVGANVQKRARLAEFRTAYSKLESTLKSVSFDRGSIYACYYGSVTDNDINNQGLKVDKLDIAPNAIAECDDFIHAFTKALGTTHSCEKNPVEEGCIPKNYPAEGCSNYNFQKAKRAYVFDNSMIFMTYFDTDSSDFAGRMAIDINGRKGPNKWGHDLFPLSLTVAETAKVNGKLYVKDVYFGQPNFGDAYYKSCFINGSGKSTNEMMQESSGKR